MEPQEPNNPHNLSASEEALRRLEERLSRASEAAERLIVEAAGSAQAAAAGAASAWAAAGGGESGPQTAAAGTAHPDTGNGDGESDAPGTPPPAGWQTPPSGEDRRGGDLELLLQFVQSVRELIPPDLQRRLAEALRELLLAIRALIDWYLERNEQRRAGGDEVQDIPIL